MRKPGGYVTITTERPTRATFDNGSQHIDIKKEGVFELEAFSCHHCNRIVHVMPKCDPTDLGGHCKVCDRLICQQCYGKGGCDTLEAKLERAEASYHARRSYGL